MIKIRKLILGQMQTNCYLIFEGIEKNTIIIDPGDDADYIESAVADLSLKPKLILATHGHFDHVLAVTELKLAYKIPFLMHKADEFLLKRMGNSAKHFSHISADPPPIVDENLNDKDIILITNHPARRSYASGVAGGQSLITIHTPGHTPGSVSFYLSEAKVAFVGDTLFEDNAIGRTDFSYSDTSSLASSVRKLKKLPRDTTFYPGHGREFSLY